MSDYQVWECKVIIDADAELPEGFDAPPRCAVEQTIRAYGFEPLSILSGWGGKLTKVEEQVVDESVARQDDAESEHSMDRLLGLAEPTAFGPNGRTKAEHLAGGPYYLGETAAARAKAESEGE